MQNSTTQIIDSLLDKYQISDPTKRDFYASSVLKDSISYLSQSLSDVDFSSPERHAKLLRIVNNKQQELFTSHFNNIEYAYSLASADPTNTTLRNSLTKAVADYQSEVRIITDIEVQKHLSGIREGFLKVIKTYRQDVADYVSKPDHNPELAELLREDRENIVSINKQFAELGKSGSFSKEEILKFKELFNDALAQVQASRERVAQLNNPAEPAAPAATEPRNPLIAKGVERLITRLLDEQKITPEHRDFLSKRFAARLVQTISSDIEGLGLLPESPEFIKIIEREYSEIFKKTLAEFEPQLARRTAQHTRLMGLATADDSIKIFDTINEIESELDSSIEDVIARSAQMLYRETKVFGFRQPLNEKIHRLEFLSDSMFRSFKQSILNDAEYSHTLAEANKTLEDLFYQRSQIINQLRYDNEGKDDTLISEDFNEIERKIDVTIQIVSIQLETQINKKTQSYLEKVAKQMLLSLDEVQTTMQLELHEFQEANPNHPALKELKKTITKSYNTLSSIISELQWLSKANLSQDENIEDLEKIINSSINCIENCRKDIHFHQKKLESKKELESEPELDVQASFLNRIMDALKAILRAFSSLFSKAKSLEPSKPRGPMTFSTTNADPSGNTPRPQSV